MNHGAGWIIFEESYPEGNRKLLSILPARRSAEFVAQFMEQAYVDRFASLSERLSYKKQPKHSPFKVMTDIYGGPMHVGHQPFFVGIYGRKILLTKNVLTFTYRIAASREDPFNPVFEERHQSLVVDI